MDQFVQSWIVESFLAFLFGVALFVLSTWCIPELSQFSKYGRYLGIFLILLSAVGFFLKVEVRTTIDTARKQVRIERTSSLGSSKREIPFSQIVRVNLKRRSDDYHPIYHLQLLVSDGEEIDLPFSTWIKDEAVSKLHSLVAQIGCEYLRLD